MNLQSTHNLKVGKIKKNKIKRVTRKKERNVKAVLPILVLIAMVFALAAASVRLESETEALSREASTLQSQIHRQNRSISNYDIRIAALKGEVIFSQIRRFKLNLHNPTAGQIRRLRISGAPERRSTFSTREPELLLSRR